MNRFASISNLLQMITGIMAAVLVFTFAIAAGRDWERWNAALEARAVVGVSVELFTALQNIRVERGTVNTALTAAEAASAETQADIAALRHKSEGALQSALARLDKLQLGEELTRVSDLQSKRSTLAKLRQEADTAMRLPKADRPATPTKSWVGAVNPVVEAIDGLSDRLLVGAAIAGNNGLPQDQQRQLAELAGRMAAGWKLIGTMLQQPGMPAQVKAAYAAAEDTYFTALAEKRKAIVADLVAGQAPSLSGAEWVKLSTPGLKSVIDV